MTWISIGIGVAFLLLIAIAFYKVVIKRRPVSDMYTPFDNATSGKDDGVSRQPIQDDETYIEPRTEQKRD